MPPPDLPVIDFHIHFTPADLQPQALGASGGKPVVEYLEGAPVYLHHRGARDLARHIDMMDHAGVDISMISSGPGMEGTLDVCRRTNDALAEGARTYPGRLEGLAHTPPLGGNPALDELRRAVQELGFRGAVVTSTIEGRALDDPQLESYWSLAEELDIFVLVHPGLKQSSLGLRNFDRFDLFRTVGREFDLQLATLALVLGGVLDRHQHLRVIMAHLGGGLAGTWGRVRRYQNKEFWGVADDPDHGRTGADEPDSYLQRLFFDTGGFFGDLNSIRAALTQIPASQILFGTDYPQELRSAESIGRFTADIRSLGAIGEGILSENAARLLGNRLVSS